MSVERSHQSQKFAPVGGFSLVEVLVSIVILCIGLLGVVGLQAVAIKSNREARFQSVGVQLARELSDLVRVNKNVAPLTTNNPYVGVFKSTSAGLVPPNPKYCLSVRSSAACASDIEVAQAQMTEWLVRVSDALPGARVDTCFDTAPYTAAGVPQWTCTAGAGAPFVIKIGWTRSALDKSLTGNAAFDYATLPAVIVSLSP